MKWKIPDTTGKKRWDVGPCIVTLEDGETVEEIALAIAMATIKKATPLGLGVIPAFLQEMSGEEVITEEEKESLRQQLQCEGKIDIDYWKGRAVKLLLKVIDQVIHIDVNYWIDRLPECPIYVPNEAIDELEGVLEIADQKEVIK